MIKNIIFDFDGVILDSILVKTEAFKSLFSSFEDVYVNKLVAYHKVNGGMSRYLKIKYFFNIILSTEISDDDLLIYTKKYSELTKLKLSKQKYIIKDTMRFIENNFLNYKLHIASGADHYDLSYICESLGLCKYFLSIDGSPKVKSEIVTDIMNNYDYKNEETVLIGDSINDYEAAAKNDICFIGYNNPDLRSDYDYIESFGNIKI